MNHSEIASPDVVNVVLQEGVPGLPSLLAYLGHVLLDGAFADFDPQFEQFSTDAFCTPQEILPGYLLDQLDGFWQDARLSRFGFGLSPPVAAEQIAVPAQQGIGLHNVESLLPEPGKSGKQDQTHPVSVGKLRALDLALEHDQLLSQHGVLNDQLLAAALQV